MTLNRSQRTHIARIEATRDIISQAAAEGRHDETVWTTWEQLFSEGSYAKARAWWVAEIQPSFTTQA
jgi:hypothetical protein